LITGHTKLYCLLADPVEHVRTPEMFNDYLRGNGSDAVVFAAHVARDALAHVVCGLRGIRNLRGIIVTIPHKIDIVALCNDLDPSARRAGAVNFIRREPDGRLLGANFDGVGFVGALEAAIGTIRGRSVFVAGAGGVARAIAFEIARAGVARLALHARSVAKADALLAAVAKAFPVVSVVRAGARPRDCDVAINATSLGLDAADPLPFAVDALSANAVVADVVMQPLITSLLQRARERGLAIVTGDAMLRFQLPLWIEFIDAPAARATAAPPATPA
jgi:shikimate dehydrogenase